MEPLHIFFHVATLGQWSTIYDHIYDTLQESGILKNATLHVSAVGHNFNKNVSNCLYTHHSTNTKQYEFPTLNLIWNHAQKSKGAVLYIHTKGATRPGPTVDQWRQMMLHFTVKRWQKALHYLHEYDAVGCNLQNNKDGTFFSGNFWWSTCEHLKTLPDPNQFIKSRICGETWVGMKPVKKFYSLHSSSINHYTTRYPVEKYNHL